MYKARTTAPQFQLRVGGRVKKGEELTEVARNNLLIEMAAARGDKAEEALVCKHYTVGESTGRGILKKWRERATVQTATRTGRRSIMEGDEPGGRCRRAWTRARREREPQGAG